ncbi:MAG: GtrA family protein [Bacteroidales bacterium]|nr:GtrA family protein [Bacteroidales bacterium]
MNLYKTLVRLVEFSASSLLGTLVDTLVVWLCSHFWLTSYVGEYIISPVISFECAVFTNFVMAYRVIWRDRIPNKTRRTFMGRFLAYNLSCTGVFLIKMGLLLLIQRWLKLDVVWCNLIAVCITGGINFLINERIIFRKCKEKE